MAANQTFGESVAEARALLGMSVTGAAGTLQMTESMLEDIEDGLVDMNPELQEIFERAYSIDLTSAVSGPPRYVEREPLSYDAEAGHQAATARDPFASVVSSVRHHLLRSDVERCRHGCTSRWLAAKRSEISSKCALMSLSGTRSKPSSLIVAKIG